MTTPILRMHNLAVGNCECSSIYLHKEPCNKYVQADGKCHSCGHGLACHVAKKLEEQRRKDAS